MKESVLRWRWLQAAKAFLVETFDQDTPLGRLALVHVFMMAGDTLLAISLAGSLFFSISPDAAKSQVILYLLLTMAPFAVVAPLLAPILDKGRESRRKSIVLTGGTRVVICLLMAVGVHSLVLFPEAFAMLVLSKLYQVSKSAFVPTIATAMNRIGAVEEESTISSPRRRAGKGPYELAVINARLTLIASIAGFVIALPGVGILKLSALGAPWVLRMDAVVFLIGTAVALRLPRHGGQLAPSVNNAPSNPETSRLVSEHREPHQVNYSDSKERDRTMHLTPRQSLARPTEHPEALLAVTAMSVLRGSVGFLVFLLAFALRREHAGMIWYGALLAASGAGSMLGSWSVPHIRKVLFLQQILTFSLVIVAVTGIVAAVVGGVPVQAGLGAAIGLAGAIGKPSFDAIVQRYIPPMAQGRAFARFEMRLQLTWVVGGLLPVLAALPLVSGDVVIAVVASITAISYFSGRRALGHHSLHVWT